MIRKIFFFPLSLLVLLILLAGAACASADPASLEVVTERGDGTSGQAKRGEGSGAVSAGLARRIYDMCERHLSPDALAEGVDVGVYAEATGDDDGRLFTHVTTVSRGCSACRVRPVPGGGWLTLPIMQVM